MVSYGTLGLEARIPESLSYFVHNSPCASSVLPPGLNQFVLVFCPLQYKEFCLTWKAINKSSTSASLNGHPVTATQSVMVSFMCQPT